MIRSMTGFGTGKAAGKYGTIKAELRSVNHKFFEMGARLPDGLLGFEDRIRELGQKFVKRGKVNLVIIYEDGLESADKVLIDEKLVKKYHTQLSALKRRMKLDGSIRLDHLISLPGVVTYEAKKAAPLSVWPLVEDALEQAFCDLNRARSKEGAVIRADIQRRINNIQKATQEIRVRSKINVALYKDRLAKSIQQLAGSITKDIDKGRLEQEVALYAKNSDITEEIVRILAHVKNVRETLREDDEAGKKLDFICQELNREINTVGSKASDFKISKKVIQIKSEIEKLREQAKNIE